MEAYDGVTYIFIHILVGKHTEPRYGCMVNKLFIHIELKQGGGRERSSNNSNFMLV